MSKKDGILHLTLHRKWFDQIASRVKKEEYRANTVYWQKRLNGIHYKEIFFRNGYNSANPFMRVKCLGIYYSAMQGEWVIRLGKILEIKNWRQPE